MRPWEASPRLPGGEDAVRLHPLGHRPLLARPQPPQTPSLHNTNSPHWPGGAQASSSPPLTRLVIAQRAYTRAWCPGSRPDSCCGP